MPFAPAKAIPTAEWYCALFDLSFISIFKVPLEMKWVFWFLSPDCHNPIKKLSLLAVVKTWLFSIFIFTLLTFIVEL